jgi:hypothetical protein
MGMLAAHTAMPPNYSARLNKTVQPTTNAPPFVSLLQVLLLPDGSGQAGAASAADNASAAGAASAGGGPLGFTVATASPDSIANAIIRAMLGGGSTVSQIASQIASPITTPAAAAGSKGMTNSSGPALAEAFAGTAPVAPPGTLLPDTPPPNSDSSGTTDPAERVAPRKRTAASMLVLVAGSALSAPIPAASADSFAAATQGRSSNPDPAATPLATPASGATNEPTGAGTALNPPAVQPLSSGPLAFGAAIVPKPGPPATGTNPAVGPNEGTNAGTDREAPPSESFPERQDQSAPSEQTARAGKAAASSTSAPADPLSASPQPGAGHSFAAAALSVPQPSNGTAAVRSAEPERTVSEIAAPPAAPVLTTKHDMLLRVSAPESNSSAGANVDIRVTQRAGEVLVTVHTPDPALQANLRQDLPELVNSLDRAGFETVTFTPRTAALATAAASGAGLENGAAGSQADTSSPGGAFGSKSGSGFRDSGSPGQFSGEQHAPGQQARDRLAQHWLDQMEE